MTDNPYQILGPTPARLRGREVILQRLLRGVSKASPDHLSLVGPRRYGKTVLLQGFTTRVQSGQGGYLVCALIDLRHNTPRTDHDFRKLLAEHVGGALFGLGSDLADYVRPAEEVTQDDLELLFGELDDRDQRVLLVLDGFDAVLRSPQITRNWWDNLRDLAKHTSLCLITGSRAPLRELCVTEGSQTSDFWAIFDTAPVRVLAFAEDDWDSLLLPFVERGAAADQSARRELVNWSGGVPLLVAGLLHVLYAQTEEQSKISKEHVDRAAQTLLQERTELLRDVWEDCGEGLKQHVIDLVTNGEMSAAAFSETTRREMLDRGFAEPRSQARIRLRSRLLEQFAQAEESSVSTLRRLFASSDDYVRNMPAALELRLLQLNGTDPKLRLLVQRALRELSNPDGSGPPGELVLMHLRNIEDRAFELIWDVELPDKPALPIEWARALDLNGFPTRDGRRYDMTTDRGQRRWLLRTIVQPHLGPLARVVSRQTSSLIDLIGSAGNIGQHLEQDIVTLGFGLMASHAAVALCETLTQDLAAGGASIRGQAHQ